MSLNTPTAFVKRRLSDDDEDEIRQEWPTYKRFNDTVVSTIQPSMLEKQQEENASMPAITYASPDYRPPVNPNALWLQPPPQQQQQQLQYKSIKQQQSKLSGLTMMVDETDSTDEDDLPTLAQTPSSILLDESFKGSSFEQNNWNHSFDQHHVSTTASWHH
ncbi:hypothetical protein BDA99DRAFT_505649 [Phascolomyces articulosus]|uniref:Uncharacterized protein n=1 Tax=Phascolomyces articulosus TaxID=60185 RepID=A0AAD5PGS7_9FUNG|nr:hypothetical protein BDA99DRAFT_505649 [Phascolomyces articulosus]